MEGTLKDKGIRSEPHHHRPAFGGGIKAMMKRPLTPPHRRRCQASPPQRRWQMGGTLERQRWREPSFHESARVAAARNRRPASIIAGLRAGVVRSPSTAVASVMGRATKTSCFWLPMWLPDRLARRLSRGRSFLAMERREKSDDVSKTLQGAAWSSVG